MDPDVPVTPDTPDTPEEKKESELEHDIKLILLIAIPVFLVLLAIACLRKKC